MLQKNVDEFIFSLSPGGYVSGRKNSYTVVAYRTDLHQVSLYVEEQGVDNWQDVTHEHIAGYLLQMRDDQGYRPTTIARKLASLKSFFRYMRRAGMIVHDPVEHLESPRVPRVLPRVLSVEQMSSLLRQMEVETAAGRRDLALLYTLYTTGMRVTELVSLNLDDFDVVSLTVRCAGHDEWNRRERVLPLPPVAAEAIQRYRETVRPRLATSHPEERALFLNQHGRRLTRQGLWLIIKGYARLAGITTITPHMLRHSFAMLMLNEGMELRSVQELLGYSHISAMQGYSQLARVEEIMVEA